MSWADLKQQARDAVHVTMSVPAFYTDATNTELPISARLHRKSAYIGEDFDEFSPGLFSTINRVIVDRREMTPQRGGALRFPDYQDVVVKIENVQNQGEHYALCEVRI